MTAVGGPEVLVSKQVPAPRPRAGEVLIRTEAIPVLFPETLLRSGAFPFPAPTPLIFGMQAAGVVVEIGAGVDAALIGQRVMVASNSFGTYAEQVCAPVESVTAIPDGLSPVEAAAVTMSASVAIPLLETAALTGTETVLIEVAATGVGGYLTQLAKEYGAARVIATAGGPVKADRARELGADEVIDHTDPDWPQGLPEILGGTTIDVVFDALGGDSARTLLDLMTPLRGRMLSYGWLSGAPAQVTAMDLIMRGLTLTGCSGPAWLAGVDRSRATALTRAATGSITPLLDRVLPLDQAAAAHQLIADRVPVGTIVLQP
ncbi:quinone oxidoreductase family protein [Nocardia huaxiensis]|uniref:quinone oxidoreductase family protein n=1 Tax=Nocardia huaxiensis TaxID=2755382 RepID=UPI001E51EE81|nr:zinc-binding dehydrogenase [Nocardia huaxiensis]UFS97438.1 zinc-binding dehydrogenase [Nocardia huaxiensis]